MRLEFNVCTCHWMTHPPSQLAASPGGGDAGRGGAGAAAEGRDRPVLAVRSPSSSSRPSVPSTSFNPGDRAVWKECPTQACRWFAGPLHPGVPWLSFHPQSRGSRSSASLTHLRSGVGQQQPWKPRVGVSPSQGVRMEASPAACQRSSAFRELLVFTGVSAHPRSLAPSSREEGTGHRKRH